MILNRTCGPIDSHLRDNQNGLRKNRSTLIKPYPSPETNARGGSKEQPSCCAYIHRFQESL